MRRAAASGLAAPGALLAVATAAANALGYALVVALGRTLAPVDYGAVAALLNLAVIGAVPGLALQLVAARTVAAGGGEAHVRALRRLALTTGAALAGLVAVASPLLAGVLHLSGPLPVLAVAATLVPATVTAAAQGLLQGAERFGRLSLVYLAVAVPRFAAGAGAAALGGGVDGVLAGTLAAAVLAAAVALTLLPRVHAPAPPDGDRVRGPSWRELVRSGLATAGLLTLANVDVLLARAVLPPAASGVYAAGSVFAKMAFWGPQFVSTLLYPRMAVQASRRAAVAAATAVTAGLGLCVVAVTAAGGGPLVGLVLGPRYAGLGRAAAVFAALGATLAVVQVLVYAGVAAGDRRPGTATWAGIAVVSTVVLLTRPAEPLAVAGIVLAGALGVAAAGLALELTAGPGGRTPRPVEVGAGS